jgi:hypothetical protein
VLGRRDEAIEQVRQCGMRPAHRVVPDAQRLVGRLRSVVRAEAVERDRQRPQRLVALDAVVVGELAHQRARAPQVWLGEAVLAERAIGAPDRAAHGGLGVGLVAETSDLLGSAIEQLAHGHARAARDHRVREREGLGEEARHVVGLVDRLPGAVLLQHRLRARALDLVQPFLGQQPALHGLVPLARGREQTQVVPAMPATSATTIVPAQATAARLRTRNLRRR